MPELWMLSATELVRQVRTGQVSSREVVQAHLHRIDEVNPVVNALTAVLDEQALAAADAVDQALRCGEEPGPLCGIPVTVKENVDVAGSATTQGIPALRDAIATQDAPHIAELRAAGAIPIARTNMPEFGMRWHTTNGLHGATRNPWSAEHTPGGSSGGDAVAVATGLAPLGLGTDGAGSLRWPAQCCGVAALKPSLGRVAQSDGRRPTQFAFQLLGVHGPIARHVDDLRLAFTHICASDGGDPWHAPVPLNGPPVSRPIRVSMVTAPGGIDIHPAVRHALRRAADLLTDAGYVVEECDAPALERAGEIYTQIMASYGRVQRTQPPVKTVASDDFARFWQVYEPIWAQAQGEPTFDPMMERAAIARGWSDWFGRTPLVLAPIRTQPAFVLGCDLDPVWLSDFPATMRLAVAVNLLGLPAVAIPTGETDGLPHAVQVIAPRFREDLCLDAAAAIEARIPPFTPINPHPNLASNSSATVA
ncbi:amidase [Salinispora arenicola]|uniref:amidase n=1 Tax=Salinispora arenicola TaxID=168697 RepID=UPI000382E0D6|nr:amidase [Salinispora arenicola]